MSRLGLTFERIKRPLGVSTVPLLAWLICALIWSGCLIWIDNSLAIIPDDDSTSIVQLELIDGYDHGRSELNLYESGAVPAPHHGTVFVRGNGDSDDNREDCFLFKRVSGDVSPVMVKASVSNFDERRTAIAYMDFGHLKVMPAAEYANSRILVS